MMSLLLNSMLERKKPTRIALMISEDMGIELARMQNIQGQRVGNWPVEAFPCTALLPSSAGNVSHLPPHLHCDRPADP